VAVADRDSGEESALRAPVRVPALQDVESSQAAVALIGVFAVVGVLGAGGLGEVNRRAT
jgi:hypothetical protein